jgi:glycosyltransferase involved in cell wall biosynthesis
MPLLLILCEYPTLLGGERSMLVTLRAVRAAGFDVHVAAPGVGPMADTVRECGVPLVDWSQPDQLQSVMQRVRPDLVHANSLSTARLAGPLAAAAGIPGIGHLRDIVKLSQPAIDSLNSHQRLVAVSRATRDFHVAQGIDEAKCVVVTNGVDLQLFRPRPASGYLHRELRLPADARLVATIGQVGLRKGTDVALAAARLVPAVHWLVVGERTSHKEESRQFEQRLHALAAEPLLAGRVHFLGSRDDVHELLPECALLVHAARQEPLGRVLLEAAACGLAVVVTDVGGTREIFRSEADGAVLVSPDDPPALADVVGELLRDDARRRSLGHAARRRAETAFDADAAAGRLIAQYRAVL